MPCLSLRSPLPASSRPVGMGLILLLVLLAAALMPVAAQAHAPHAAGPLPIEQETPASYLPIARTLGGPLALLTSPDGTVKARITVTQPNSRSGLLRFDISHGARSLVTSGRLGVSATGIDAEGVPLALFAAATEYVLVGVTERSVREEYTLAIAERSRIPNHFNEVTIALRTKLLPERRLNLVVRAYDEGVALRYVIPAQPGVARAIFSAESTQFLFPVGTSAYEQRPLPARASGSAAAPVAPGAVAGGWSEGVYARVPLGQLSPAMPMPLTLDFGGGEYGAIFEAAVDNFARSSLVRVGSPTTGVALRLEGPSEAALPYATPWRTLMLAPSAGELIERNYLLYNLAAPSPYSAAQLAEFAAMPGTAMRVQPIRLEQQPDGSLLPIFSTQLSKDLVDFAATRGIDYIAFDTGWYGPEFDVTSDPTVPRAGLDVAAVAAHGLSKGVGVILYVNQTQLNRNIDAIAGLYASWGVMGIKLGFVNGTSQQGIELVHYSVERAAEYGLFVDVHDAYRPSGMSRTYPNLFTQEGVAGAEHALDAGHTTNLPFTRFIIGAADYTLPYYWAGLPTTRGHQLGLAVIFYSPLNFVFWYDSPSQYDASPGADFLASVPTAWDETQVLEGTPGQSAAVARRKGNTWYVGAITNQTARSLPLTLDFLTPGVTYTARLYSEPARNNIVVEERSVVQGDVVETSLLAGGGFALQITPAP